MEYSFASLMKYRVFQNIVWFLKLPLGLPTMAILFQFSFLYMRFLLCRVNVDLQVIQENHTYK